jgi:hypothetical protein
VASKRLSIYLNDHLAAAVGAVQLAGRAASSNQGTPLAEALGRLAEELEDDRRVLVDLMRTLGVGVDQKKVAAAWIGEKLGRVKLNGSWISYSPLSRLEELEILTLGVEGKLLLWQALARQPDVAALAAPDLDELISRARRQRRRLNDHRLEAARAAL